MHQAPRWPENQQQAAVSQAAKASGVFADDDNDDALWPQDDVILMHQTVAAKDCNSVMQPELVDLTGPVQKKARTSV